MVLTNSTKTSIHPAQSGFAENHTVNGQVLQGGFLPSSTRILIMGTFPPPRVMHTYEQKGLDHFFYYQSPSNHFWNRVEAIVTPKDGLRWKHTAASPEELSANISRKRALCAEMGWGFMDYFSEVERKEENSSKDIDLKKIASVFDNSYLTEAIRHLASLQCIACVYKTALDGLLEDVLSHGDTIEIVEDDHTADGNRYIWTSPAFSKSIDIVLLFPATRSYHSKEEKNTQYRHFLKR